MFGSLGWKRVLVSLDCCFSSRFSSSVFPPLSSVPTRSFGLDEFFVNQQVGRTGRMWRCSDLRLKSFSDLQKLWFVLIKERNMLETYRYQSKAQQIPMINGERIRKVRKSLAHIKQVLGERFLQFKLSTEPDDSVWRKNRESRLSRLKSRRNWEKRISSLPQQIHRQKENHPKRKKIKFRKIKPISNESNESLNNSDPPTDSNSSNSNSTSSQVNSSSRTMKS